MRLCLTTQVKHDSLEFFIGKVCVNPCLLFLEGMIGDIRCSGIFEFGSKCATEMFQKLDKIEPRVYQGRPTSVQGGTHQRFRKTGRAPDRESQTKRAIPVKYQATGSNMGAKIWKLGVFGVIFFSMFFRIMYLMISKIVCSIILELFVASLFIICLELLEVYF